MNTPTPSAHSGEQGKPSGLQQITDRIARDWADRNNLDGVPVSTLRVAIDDARSIPELERKHEQSEPVGNGAQTPREAFGWGVPPPPSEQAGIAHSEGCAISDAERDAIAVAIQARNRHTDLPTVRFWVEQVIREVQSAFIAHPAPEAQAEGEPALYAAADWQDELRIDGGVIVGPASESFVVPLYLRPQPSASETPSGEEREIVLPINDAVPAPDKIESGNLFLWNWRSMQQYARTAIAAQRKEGE